MEKINFGYVPANMPGGPTMNNSMFKNKILGWWNDNCLIRYPKILLSAYHLLNSKKTLKLDDYDKLREYFNIDKEVFFIMDSGGFSMSTLGDIDILPQDVIDLSIKFDADVMMSLDIPPYNLLDETKPFTLNDEEFNKKMERSYQNAKYMGENRQDYKGKYYMCIHGDSIERLDRWWDKMSDIEFDGVAMAPKNKSDYWVLAQTLLWAYNKGLRENLHLLAFSGVMTIPVLAYFSKYIKNLTYDSSSWAGGAIRREYCMPLLKQKILIGNSTNYNIKIPIMNKVGKKLDSINDFNHPQIGGVLLSLHNLIEYENYDSLLHNIVSEPEVFKDFINTYISPKLKDVFEYIDFGIKHGLDLANKKYQHKFNEEEKTKQVNIFNF